jgi:short-subunit dehydrogenase
VQHCTDKIEATLGPIDLIILNAGISATSTTAKPQAELFRTIMETNYLGVTNALSALVPKMAGRGRGHIAWVASLAGYNGLPGAAAYNASKAALVSLAEASREELAPKGITLTIVNPGFVRTKMTEKNQFPMPFMVEPKMAAKIIIKGLRKKKYEIAFPWQLAWLVKFMRLLPYPLFFWLVRVGVIGKSKSRQ